MKTECLSSSFRQISPPLEHVLSRMNPDHNLKPLKCCILILSFRLRLNLPNSLFTPGSLTKIMYSFLISHARPISPLFVSSLFSVPLCFLPPVTPSHLDSQILLCSLFLNTRVHDLPLTWDTKFLTRLKHETKLCSCLYILDRSGENFSSWTALWQAFPGIWYALNFYVNVICFRLCHSQIFILYFSTISKWVSSSKISLWEISVYFYYRIGVYVTVLYSGS